MAETNSATAGSVTVTTSGTATSGLLAVTNAVIANAGADIDNFSAFSNVPLRATQGTVITVSNGNGYSFHVPTGAAAMIVAAGTTARLFDGDPTLDIASAGTLTYSGDAGTIDSFGDNSVIIATLDAARLAAAGANLAITLAGQDQTLALDNGVTGTVSVSGAGAAVTLGVAADTAATIPGGGRATVTASSNTTLTLNDASASTFVTLAGDGNEVHANAGRNTVVATTGSDVYFGGAASTEFVGSSAANAGVATVFGGSGNDTVFANGGVNYTAGSGRNIFVGGGTASLTVPSAIHHSTVTLTDGNDAIFGGDTGQNVLIGSGSSIFVGQGGTDTLSGGSASTVVFGGDRENAKLIATKAAVIVANGANETIDASLANQGNQFWVNDGASVGNTTLVGSLASPAGYGDLFLLQNTGSAEAAAHTVTIQDFVQGDVVFLLGYSQADRDTFAAAVDGHAAQGGGLSFTLSDNTTVNFTGNHPTGAFDNGGDAA